MNKGQEERVLSKERILLRLTLYILRPQLAISGQLLAGMLDGHGLLDEKSGRYFTNGNPDRTAS